MKKKQL